jgi:prepilin-type N-terminal cleavage/methylation domain-containing protein
MPRRAFSLIELLVVIAIIGVLVSILLPALSGTMARARESRCLSNCRQAVMALTAYAGDNKAAFPAVPVPTGLASTPNQYRYGGLAGFFSLNQTGDGSSPGFMGGTYSNGSEFPIMCGYLSAPGVLKCPPDRADRYYGNPYGPMGNTSFAAATPKRPEVCGPKTDVVSYNISYLYFTGHSARDYLVLWADETNGPDLDALAWYGPGFPGQTSANSTAAGAAGIGRYAHGDNHAAQGGCFASSDGSARFEKNDRSLPPGGSPTCVD